MSKWRFTFVLCAVLLSGCSSIPSQTPDLTLTSTPTAFAAIATFTSTPQPSQTATPKPGLAWEGEWFIYVNGNQNEWDGTAEFQVNDDYISGTFSLYDPEVRRLNYTFTGKLEEAYSQASGDWQLINGGTGTFAGQLNPKKPYQFAGNLDSGKFTFAFCGWRAGSSRPDPCKWP